MSIESLAETICRWAAEVASPDTGYDRKRSLRDWAFGVSVALDALGVHEDVARAADDVCWGSDGGPRDERN